MSRNVNKTLKFGYFKAIIHCNLDDLKQKINNLEKSKNDNDIAKLKIFNKLYIDMKNVESIISDLIIFITKDKISSVHEINGKLIEFDKSTFISQKEHVFFQMVHDRDDALSKKRINKARESIPLDDDEYISEFSGIIYDKASNQFMVQHNRYSVSIKQIGEFLSKCLKEKYQLELMKSQEIKQFPATIELQAIMDKNRLNDITNNKCLEKMTIKGNLSAVENIKNSTDINLPIFNINDSISNINGYEFTLTITANKTREKRKIEYDSIDQSACKDLYNAYANVDENKDNIDVTIQYQNNSDIREVLTWSSPLKESFIEFSVDSRKEIDFRELCRKMESVLTED